MSLDIILTLDPNPRLFPILLDLKSFQTALDSSRLMISCHVTSQSRAFSLSCHRLIIILLSISYLCPYQSLSTHSSYNNVSAMVMQQSEYLVFHDKDTPI